MLKKQILRVIACALTLLTLNGCKIVSPESRDFCLLYKPVYSAPADTKETRQQANENNAVWLDLCEKSSGV